MMTTITATDRIGDIVSAMERADRARHAINVHMANTMSLTLNQLLVLSEVEHQMGNATVSSLSATFGRAVHTLTSTVNGLERKGLVSRRVRPGADRRIVRIRTTTTGVGKLEDFRSSRERAIHQFLEAGDSNPEVDFVCRRSPATPWHGARGER